ncbi:MAG: glycerol uptake operon antiterminator [Petroclostridium sp.]|jgi:glycerol uptake operon antiterminator|uniref:glycerol-3-phosphate responsive antiterminator n=1 Tax=Petroclostridium xylanilyticum TaxID=1792311 RepID=UPI000B988FC0|nr:glycerol-3-phosphate responsive antiterminator [Petroclostridium xylanilyticum]MBZ4645937.1 glycerol-3-phosphate responsive antiterminator [Clostridia bacterium]MDK2810758.1 glycerol uptake operon antiterminator [Petroclostridium sp.]
MNKIEIIEKIEENPIIAAIRKEEDVDIAVTSQVTTVFLLHADIFNIKSLVDRVKNGNKSVFIHIDFLEGIGRDYKAIDYISKVIGPDGIISTKSSSIKYAQEKGIFTIQRFFLIDSLSYETTIKTVQSIQPDMIEIMPGVMPGIIKRINCQLSCPVIAGGLIDSKEDIIEILKAGALGASTGKKELWIL